ncbi:cisplatin damage response ATP-dependent DNA ligase [Erythrobacter sp. YT30]|uniref:cisplatin damage response ATP-dependent DNA ligase n=1 Tax=Erythrobacter sp. YT30 TaxID=1735012 RepID=UPI00076D8816|nr:cisplatin damage response ATP-dependent DNA ligase [Erythrobacter sp. YT30]KWV91389.1 ATP-dependent DNA ligase [Erythrobacter sp. YT30]
MKAFATLLDTLVYTTSRNRKLALIAEYLRNAPDPDRGWALGALTGELDFPAVKSSTIRNLMKGRVDPVLWTLSRDFVGDTAETASLLWPSTDLENNDFLTLTQTVETLSSLTRVNAHKEMPKLLDRLDANGRFALIKLATGGMRIGVSARLAKTAFAKAFDVSLDDVEEYWHAIDPPYAELFQWAAEGGDPPDIEGRPRFRPFMLAHPLEDTRVDLSDYAAEWKWDGIRVQLCRVTDANGEAETRLYSRSGDDISATFPELLDVLPMDAVLDGELLVRGSTQGGEAGSDKQGGAASFNALQQRLGRKTVSKKMLAEAPAFVRLYDALLIESEDLREHGWEKRRGHLENLVERLPDSHFDLSAVVEARDFDHLAEIRETARDEAIEGLMLKRRDAPYIAGRKVGLWYKWKRDPLLIDCVLMYAQRGSGKRSSFYSDYTFGCWAGDPDQGAELLPVGKAYSGFTDAELKKLDRLVRQTTLNRFGPVREVERTLVFEVAFDSVHTSKRHKSGLAMRFPRIHRIRWDKPVHEADRIDALKALVPD